MTFSKESTAWNIYLLVARLWLGYSMIKGGQSILRFFSSQELRDFFENWFGNELGFPALLFMSFIANVTDFVGAILVCLGLFTRVSGTMIAIVMRTATLTANIDYSGKDGFPLSDGLVTISCFLFGCLTAFTRGGRYTI